MGQIKVALVHDFLTVYAGAERVLKELHELFPEAPIYTILANDDVTKKHFPKAKIVTSPLQRSFLRNHPAWLLPWMPQAVEHFNFTDFDLVISSSGAFSHGIITGPDTKHICYCHSPMRYAWDWHAEYLRERGIDSPLAQFMANQFMTKLRVWDVISAKRVDQWIANSQTVADRLKKYYRVESTVIHPPVDTDFFDPDTVQKRGTGTAYVITVSRLSKNKRIDHIIRAASGAKVPLVIIGEGEDRERLEALAKQERALVNFLGGLNEEEKRRWLVSAQCFIFAAEDDFGIAPVEAMALGVPVVALGRGGATETVKDGVTGRLYAEPSVPALQAALQEFLATGVSGTPAVIRHHSLAFSKEKFSHAIRNLVGHE